MKRIRLIVVGLLCGCSVIRPAVDIVDAACQLGLVRSPAVIAAADDRTVAPEWLADVLCSVPAVVNAWEDARQQRAADPGAAAVDAARREGLL